MLLFSIAMSGWNGLLILQPHAWLHRCVAFEPPYKYGYEHCLPIYRKSEPLVRGAASLLGQQPTDYIEGYLSHSEPLGRAGLVCVDDHEYQNLGGMSAGLIIIK